MWGAVLAALASAFCFALAAALQHREALRVGSAGVADFRLLWKLSHRPLWLVGTAADVLSMALHVLALSLGTLALVQPVGISGIVFAIPLAAVLRRQRIRPLDMWAAVGVVIGLGGLLGSLPSVRSASVPSPGSIVATLFLVCAAVSLMALVAHFAPGRPRAVFLAAAAGTAFGLTAVLVRTLLLLIQRPGSGSAFTATCAAIAIVGIYGYLLLQSAYRAGHFAASLATATVTDPVVAVLVGGLLLHEGLPSGLTHLTMIGIAMVVICVGLLILVRSPIALGTFAEAHPGQPQEELGEQPAIGRGNGSRRVLLAAGLSVVAAGLAGCGKAVQAARRTVTGTQQSAGPSAESHSGQPPARPAGPAPSIDLSSPSTTGPTESMGPATTVRSTSTSSRPTVQGTPGRPVPQTEQKPTGPAEEIAHGPGSRPQVALTFHGAGDIGYANEILQITRAHQAHITVMAVGSWLAENPQIGRQILAGGHELGNHTLSHLDINSMTENGMRSEVIGCRDLLIRTTGAPGRYFRQSQSRTANSLLKMVAGEAGYPVCLSYDLDSMDWTDPGAQAIRTNLAAVRPGSIVSMHLGHAGTVQAIPGVLEDLATRGLSAVTVSTLLIR